LSGVRWPKVECWLSPEREQAELLLRKGVEDQAVLAPHGDDFPWTHDLQLLLRRLDSLSLDLPSEVRAARTLAPWAVEYRYGETVDAELDRAATVSLVAKVLDWATAQARTEP
jgi:HEPN domain-containing protein